MIKVKPKQTPEHKAAAKARVEAQAKAQKNFKPIPDIKKLLSEPKPKICFWPWSHHWTRWKTVETGQITRGNRLYGVDLDPDNPRKQSYIGNYLVQRRFCENCGKEELQTVETQI